MIIFKKFNYIFFQLLFFISTFVTFIISELYFYIPNGVDHIYHSKYLSYFLYQSEDTYSGFGLIYYYIVALITHLRIQEVNNLNVVHFMNSSIITANFILFLFGILGIYFLLRKYGFEKKTIYISLTLNNFIIPVFIMRSILKPEIFAFTLLPWVILGLDNYIKKKNLKSFLVVVLPLSVLLTIKGSVTGMIILILLIKYYKFLFFDFKKHLLSLLILAFAFGLLSYENSNVNNYNILEHNFTGSDSKYDNRAELNLLTNINLWDIIFNPEPPYHNDSLVGITLLDSFGDYFNVFIEYEEHLFIYDQDNNFINELNYKNKFQFGKYVGQYTGFLMSLFFYASCIYFAVRKKDIRAYYIAPLIGILILTISSFGFPFNHFDSNTGDTLKSNYYSFLISIAFIFVLVQIFKKYHFLKLFIPLYILFSFFYILGFPKVEDSNINKYLEEKIEISLACEPISIFLSETDFEDCHDRVKKICEYNLYSNNAQNLIDKSRLNLSINEQEPILFVNDDDQILSANNYSTCKQYVQMELVTYNPVSKGLRQLPPVNMIYFLYTFLYIFYITYKERTN